MQKLYLMQHGDSVPEETDPARPLSERGEREVSGVAAFLANAGIRPARIIHSGKTRARQTAEHLAAEVAPGVEVEAAAGLNPKDIIDPWVKQIESWANDDLVEDTVIVGHLPFLDRLTSRLVAGHPDTGVIAYLPGSVACLERSKEGDRRCSWMIRPELLGPL